MKESMKSRILALKAQGKSYNEITALLNTTKGNIAYHCSEKVKSNYHKRQIKRRRELKTTMKTASGGKCSVCGYDRCLDALQYHHINPSQKSHLVGSMFSTHCKEDIQKEIDKCVLLCANCHQEIHSGVIEL